jgi:hypothetical protein
MWLRQQLKIKANKVAKRPITYMVSDLIFKESGKMPQAFKAKTN